MKRIKVSSWLFLGPALLAVVATATAQTRPSAILNTIELKQLIERAEPADHVRLSAHFSALADQYTTGANRHSAMSNAFDGNPNRQGASGMREHAKRLAELDRQSAAALRELAIHHEALAAGKSSRVPADAGRFERGEGATEPPERELSALAARANTAADHRALEEYYVTAAKRYTAEADRHATMAATYRGTRIAMAADHCERLMKLSRDSAKEATEAAAMHRQLAERGR